MKFAASVKDVQSLKASASASSTRKERPKEGKVTAVPEDKVTSTPRDEHPKSLRRNWTC